LNPAFWQYAAEVPRPNGKDVRTSHSRTNGYQPGGLAQQIFKELLFQSFIPIFYSNLLFLILFNTAFSTKIVISFQ